MQTDTRLTDLEIKFSLQEQLLEELSQVLYEQQRTLDQLQKKVSTLLKVHAPETGPANEAPPHY